MATQSTQSSPAEPTPRFAKLLKKWSRDRQQRLQEAGRRRQLILEKAIPLFRQYGIRKVVLFGSVAEGRCRFDSDIDLYVQPLTSKRFWQFLHDIEGAIGFPIDVYTDADDPVFIKKICQRGETLYEV